MGLTWDQKRQRQGHLQFRCKEELHHALHRWVELSGLTTSKVLERLVSDFLSDDISFRPESKILEVIKGNEKLLEEYNENYRIRHKGV